MVLVELVKVTGNKYSYITEYMNNFCNIDQDHSLTFNQCLS